MAVSFSVRGRAGERGLRCAPDRSCASARRHAGRAAADRSCPAARRSARDQPVLLDVDQPSRCAAPLRRHDHRPHRNRPAERRKPSAAAAISAPLPKCSSVKSPPIWSQQPSPAPVARIGASAQAAPGHHRAREPVLVRRVQRRAATASTASTAGRCSPAAARTDNPARAAASRRGTCGSPRSSA